MKVVLQRVKNASVKVENNIVGEIEQGLLVLFGVHTTDTIEKNEWLANKIVSMRIFNDEEGQMNKSLLEIGGDILLVSQFTLYANTQKGNRPSFMEAARPEQAIPIYENMIVQLSKVLGKPIASGIFGADMQVQLLNDGPVTIILEK
jgi:D-aminoacyl-tRNA deacylase